MIKNTKGGWRYTKQRFLVFSVAFLCVLAGCAGKKRSNSPRSKGLVVREGIPLDQPLIIQAPSKQSSKKNKSISQLRPISKDSESLKNRIRSVEARLSDIPSHMLIQPISASVDAHGCYILICETSLAFDEVNRFYRKEMESLGWQKGACFESEEILYSFKKNHSSCILSLRPAVKRWGKVYPATIHVYVQR